jgi:hypothetical protein
MAQAEATAAAGCSYTAMMASPFVFATRPAERGESGAALAVLWRRAHLGGSGDVAIETDYFKLVGVAAVVMGLSHTIAKERLFAPLRERLGGMQTWPGYLVSCPYCVSHWLSFMLVPLTGAYFLPVAPDWGVLSFVLSWFLSSILITVIAAFLRVAFYWVDETQGLTRKRKRGAEERVEVERARRRLVERAAEEAPH